MKMRKRIAALIAVAMIAALMPMTAFAASDNRLNKGNVHVEKDTVLTTDRGVELVIKMKENDKLKDKSIFAINLTDGEWDETAYSDNSAVLIGDVTIRRESGSVLIVTATDEIDGEIRILMAAKITGDEPTVEIDPIDSAVSASKFAIAVASSGKAIVTVADAPVIASTDKIAKISFDEPFIGAFKKGGTFTLELRDSDFEFVDDEADIVGTKAFYGEDDGFNVVLDGEKLKVTVPALNKSQRGGFELKDVKVRPGRNAREGEIKATISGDLVDKQVVTVAKYGDFTTTLEMAKDDYNVIAGKEIDVKFTLSEDMKNAIIADRSATFTFSEDIVIHDEIVVKATDAQSDKTVVAEVIYNRDDERTNVFVVDNFYPDSKKKSSYEFETTLFVPADFEGDINLSAEGRAFSDKLEVLVATTEAPVTVEGEGAVLKVGVQKQETDAKILIKETEKDRLEQKEDLVISIADKDRGITITGADIKVIEGDLELETSKIDFDKTNGNIIIPIKRYSTEPSTIEIKNIVFKVDRTVPEGAYDVEVSGRAISTLKTTLKGGEDDPRTFSTVKKLEDFAVIGTPNTEDINKGKKAVVNFVIGNNKYLVDGVEMEMDAAPYIKDGRTMVPLRYLSTALGVDTESIKFNSGVVTIFAESGKVIQVSVGSKNLVVNGMTIPMLAAAEIIDGRTYVPVTEIGGVFGVSGSWDAATQTATFK